MKLSCTIRETDLISRGNYFIVVQVQNGTNTTKYRTQIISNTLSPKFYKNIFRFKDLNSSLGINLKLGLFSSSLTYQPQDQSQILLHSKHLSIINLKLTPQQIYELKESKHQSYTLDFKTNKNRLGSIIFQLRIQYLQYQIQNNIQSKQLQQIQFNPYESNQYLIKTNINKLEELVEQRLEEYQSLRNKWISISNTEKKVKLTQIKLQDHVEKIQNYNLNLNQKLNGKIDVENMLVSVELLKGTSKGQKLLVQKIDYLKERLRMEKQEHDQLTRKYKLIQPQINQQIDRLDRYNQLVRDVKDQQFQIQRNNQLMKIYDTRMEKLKANQYAIKSMRQGLKKTDFTAKQSLILLQDAKYKAKLQEYNKKDKVKLDYQKSINILEEIEGAAKVIDKQQQEFEFAEPFEFKLEALRNQINAIDSKIRQNTTR